MGKVWCECEQTRVDPTMCGGCEDRRAPSVSAPQREEDEGDYGFDVDKLRRCLKSRDEFLVDRGLFGEYADWLPREPSPPQPEGGSGELVDRLQSWSYYKESGKPAYHIHPEILDEAVARIRELEQALSQAGDSVELGEAEQRGYARASDKIRELEAKLAEANQENQRNAALERQLEEAKTNLTCLRFNTREWAKRPSPEQWMDLEFERDELKSELSATQEKLEAAEQRLFGDGDGPPADQERDHLAAQCSELFAENAKLREALQAIIDGDINKVRATPYRDDGKPSKHDKCPHDFYFWEGCETCIEDFARAALQKDDGE